MRATTINGKEYEVVREAEVEYRSHINGMNCLNPNNWWAMYVKDIETSEEYIAWYEDDNIDTDCEPNIDWETPDDMQEVA